MIAKRQSPIEIANDTMVYTFWHVLRDLETGEQLRYTLQHTENTGETNARGARIPGEMKACLMSNGSTGGLCFYNSLPTKRREIVAGVESF